MGKNIRVYLTAEDLELVKRLGSLWGVNKSGVFKILLTTMETWALVSRALKYGGKVTITTSNDETAGAH